MHDVKLVNGEIPIPDTGTVKADSGLFRDLQPPGLGLIAGMSAAVAHHVRISVPEVHSRTADIFFPAFIPLNRILSFGFGNLEFQDVVAAGNLLIHNPSGKTELPPVVSPGLATNLYNSNFSSFTISLDAFQKRTLKLTCITCPHEHFNLSGGIWFAGVMRIPHLGQDNRFPDLEFPFHP